MKLTKYLLVACSALLFAACSDSDDWNTDGDVTVQFASATKKAKENADLFYVPLEVTGKTNGPIRVTVDVVEAAANPAQEDVHYIITSKTVVIPNDSTEVNLEVSAVNDMEINDDREFTITITNVEGAKIGAQNSTVVTITDDDSLFYEAIQGSWNLSCVNQNGAKSEFKVTIYGVDDDQEDYEKILYMSGFMGYSWTVIELNYSYDEVNNIVSLSIEGGQTIATGVNFGLGGTNDVLFAFISGDSIYISGEYTAEVSQDLQTITFEPDVMTTGAIMSGDEFTGYIWFQYGDYVLTRPKKAEK